MKPRREMILPVHITLASWPERQENLKKANRLPGCQAVGL